MRSKQSKESPFFQEFSILELLARNASHVGLDCSEGGNGNGFSVQDSAGELRSDKSEDCNCKLKADAVESFSESTLMSALADDLKNAIVASGARIVDSGGRNSSSFYFEYAVNGRKGRVEIVGKRMPPAYYTLEANLNER
jgi:hypothetical protein